MKRIQAAALAVALLVSCATGDRAEVPAEVPPVQTAPVEAVESAWDTPGLEPEAPEVAVFPQLGHSRGLNGGITSVACSPNGRRIVSASGYTDLSISILPEFTEKTWELKLWDVENGRELRTLWGHSKSVNSVAFTSDGGRIVSASSDTTVKVWDIESSRELHTLRGHRGSVSSAVFSPDGGRIVSTSSDKTVKIWDAETGRELRTLSGHSGAVSSAAFSPDGRTIVSASGIIAGVDADNTVKLWDAESGRELRTLSGHTRGVNSADFSPDGRTIVSASWDGTVKLWDTESGRELRTLTGHDNIVTSAAFSPDGRRIVSASANKTVKVWDAESGRELYTLSGHGSYVDSVTLSHDEGSIVSASHGRKLKPVDINNLFDLMSYAVFSPDGRTIVSTSGDNTVKLWDAESGRLLRTLSGHSLAVYSATFSPDGRRIVSASADKTVKVWDAETGRELHALSGHKEGYVTAVAYGPDGRHIASASDDKTVKLWDVESGRELRTFSGHTHYVESAAFSPDGRRILSASIDGTVKLWDAETGRELRTLAGHSSSIYSAAYSSDGRRIVSASSDNTVKIWDAESGRELRTLSGHRFMVTSATFSPDGRTIVSASWDETVKLWDAESGRELHTFSGHTDYVTSAVYSPDGGRIVSASWDGTVRIWDVKTGRELRTLRGHSGNVKSAAFSPDGHRIISRSGDNTIRLWDVESGKEIAEFISFDGGEWLCFTPEGYYNASPKGDIYLNVRIGNEVYGIDQYRELLFRPDLVAARLSGEDIRLADAAAVIQNAALQPPEISILSPAGGGVQGAGTVLLSAAINGRTQAIKSVRILVNGRVVGGDELKAATGSKALSVSPGRINLTGNETRLEFRIPISLQAGENRIEVLAGNGYSEGRATVRVSYVGAASAKPDAYILAVGVSSYEDPAIPGLKYSGRDARGVIAAFKAQEGKRYGTVNALALAEGGLAPTAENIRDSLAFLEKAGPKDTIVLFISGHGVSDERGRFYFLPKDAAFQADGTLRRGRTISNDELMGIRDMPGQKLVFIDSCYSEGGAGKRVRAGNSFDLVNSLQDAGMVIFTSSQANEKSWEDDELGYSLFSHAIIQGLSGKADGDENGKVTLPEFEAYVKKAVSERRPEQHPYLWTRGEYGDFTLTE